MPWLASSGPPTSWRATWPGAACWRAGPPDAAVTAPAGAVPRPASATSAATSASAGLPAGGFIGSSLVSRPAGATTAAAGPGPNGSYRVAQSSLSARAWRAGHAAHAHRHAGGPRTIQLGNQAVIWHHGADVGVRVADRARLRAEGPGKP